VAHLFLVPHDALFAGPLHALLDRGTPLAHRYSLSYLPALSSLRFLPKGTRPVATTDHLVVGVDFEPEAATTASLLGCPVILARQYGGRIPKGIVSTHIAAARGIVHVSGHAFFSSATPERSGFPLRSASTLGRADRLHLDDDGFFTLADLRSSRTSPTLLVLSGCSTGQHVVHPGDELAGIARVMTDLSIPSAIVALWPPSGGYTYSFFSVFYSLVRWGMPIGRAFRRATREATPILPSDSWGPLVLLGDFRPVCPIPAL